MSFPSMKKLIIFLILSLIVGFTIGYGLSYALIYSSLISTLKEQNEQLKKKLALIDIVVSNLSNQLSSLEAKYDKLKANHSKMLEENAFLDEELSRLMNYKEELEQQALALQFKYNQLLVDYLALKTENDVLRQNISDLNLKILHLSSEKENLEKLINDLLLEKEQLMEEYSALNSSYYDLLADYNSLLEALENQSGMAEEWRKKYVQLNSSYYELLEKHNSLLNNFNSMVKNFTAIKNVINLRQGLNASLFITPFDPIVSSLVVDITGGWQTREWSEAWRDLRKMYDWVTENIEYNHDAPYPRIFSLSQPPIFLNENWLFPNETINYKFGDCEDQAVLLTSLIRSYFLKADSDIACYVITIYSEKVRSGHAATLIPVEGEEITILDPAGHYYTGFPGELISKPISEEIENWLNYWSSSLPEAYINRAFSDYIDLSFSSTQEFINWLISS